jgi:hypothetical protein
LSRDAPKVNDVVEGRVALGEHVSDVELHFLQGLGEKDVEPASTVDEHLVEFGARDHGFRTRGNRPGSEKLVH